MQMYNFTLDLVQLAAHRLVEKKQHAFSVDCKNENPRDIVTSLDVDINTFITEHIQAAYPEHSIYSEEAVKIAGNGYQWVLDPIDGTASFARDIPQYCISIGLLQDGVPELGAVLDPISGELFSFHRGRGAFLNGREINVSERTELGRAFVLLAPGRNEEQWEWAGESLKLLLAHANKVKNFGSASLSICYIAAGRLDGLVAGTYSTIDCAAALGILKAAGGVAHAATKESVSITKDPQRVYIANNDAVAHGLIDLLEK
jgi:myo-inositol-1(or 4)-monophosphatase